ncbi:uncharacterized protein BHQ10_005838 [Talaromyces amestolkiae]|uniref:Transcription factor domain-containing protein n=1 Tax=Talaromyces amestolkiae TaxID=1196081 RepID=A0A364L204_TALAM|nr:uncharacterized protein BHQ10_005838 [Talaromyces amestolkiae]RAO69826.1 hypothetical protein BHQ10_005838 [Talaromyces amestolkiae]
MSNDMSASTETGTIPFIVETGLHKANQDTRKFIRKHVMLGKNTGKDSRERRNNKGRPRRPPPVLIPLAIAPDPNEAIHTSPNPLPSGHPPSIPQRVGTDVSLVQLADVVEPSTASLVLRFSAAAKQTLFPLESCILFDKQEGRQWIELMAFDPIFLHTMIFTTLGYHDSLRRCESPASRDTQLSLHFTQALRLLRKRLILDNDEMRFSDITLSTVLGLAVYASLTGEREAAEYHLSALRTIIDFRGGLSAFWQSGKLLLELFRCDIGRALNTGSTTFFFTDPSAEPFAPYPEKYLSCALRLDKSGMQGNQDNLVAELDNDLAKAYSIVKHFSAHINLARETKSKLPKELLTRFS